MEIMKLDNGKYAVINSARYTFNKCIFTFTIYQANGLWFQKYTEYYTIGYYNSVCEYITSNF